MGQEYIFAPKIIANDANKCIKMYRSARKKFTNFPGSMPQTPLGSASPHISPSLKAFGLTLFAPKINLE